MGGLAGLFKKPKAKKPAPMPAVKAPEPIAEAPPAIKEEGGEEAVKKARRKKGYSKTIITGSLVPTPTGKSTVLG